MLLFNLFLHVDIVKAFILNLFSQLREIYTADKYLFLYRLILTHDNFYYNDSHCHHL